MQAHKLQIGGEDACLFDFRLGPVTAAETREGRRKSTHLRIACQQRKWLGAAHFCAATTFGCLTLRGFRRV